jgi:hypothetical protein
MLESRLNHLKIPPKMQPFGQVLQVLPNLPALFEEELLVTGIRHGTQALVTAIGNTIKPLVIAERRNKAEAEKTAKEIELELGKLVTEPIPRTVNDGKLNFCRVVVDAIFKEGGDVIARLEGIAATENLSVGQFLACGTTETLQAYIQRENARINTHKATATSAGKTLDAWNGVVQGLRHRGFDLDSQIGPNLIKHVESILRQQMNHTGTSVPSKRALEDSDDSSSDDASFKPDTQVVDTGKLDRLRARAGHADVSHKCGVPGCLFDNYRKSPSLPPSGSVGLGAICHELGYHPILATQKSKLIQSLVRCGVPYDSVLSSTGGRGRRRKDCYVNQGFLKKTMQVVMALMTDAESHGPVPAGRPDPPAPELYGESLTSTATVELRSPEHHTQFSQTSSSFFGSQSQSQEPSIEDRDWSQAAGPPSQVRSTLSLSPSTY